MGPGCKCSPGHNLQSVPPATSRKHSPIGSGELPPARGPRCRGQEAVLLAHPPARVVGALSEQGIFAHREGAGSGVSATGTGSSRCWERTPELSAASRAISLPIFFSSRYGRRAQGARATTARYGRDSAAAGQGARARCGQRADRAAVGQTSGKTRSRGAALLGEINGAGVRVQPWSQSAICSACEYPQAQPIWFWRVASCKGAAVPRPGGCFVGPPTRPGRRCSLRAGQHCIQGGSGKRGFCNGYWQPPVLGAGARAAGGLSRN